MLESSRKETSDATSEVEEEEGGSANDDEDADAEEDSVVVRNSFINFAIDSSKLVYTLAAIAMCSKMAPSGSDFGIVFESVFGIVFGSVLGAI